MELTETQKKAIFIKIRSFIQTNDIRLYDPKSKKEWTFGVGIGNYNIIIRKFKPFHFGYFYNVTIQNKEEFLSKDLSLPKDIIDYFNEYNKTNYPLISKKKKEEEIKKSEYEKSRIDHIIGII